MAGVIDEVKAALNRVALLEEHFADTYGPRVKSIASKLADPKQRDAAFDEAKRVCELAALVPFGPVREFADSVAALVQTTEDVLDGLQSGKTKAADVPGAEKTAQGFALDPVELLSSIASGTAERA